MKIVITGGFGFLGRQLCRRILALGELVGSGEEKRKVSTVVLFDKAAPPADLEADDRVQIASGDVSDMAVCAELVSEDGMIVFHMASIMSGQGEVDFDLCYRVNVQGTKNLMEACRIRRGSRFVFASTGACFGERLEGPETDQTKLLPFTTYGTTKAICELLLNDYSRRGFLDGRAARLPTVIPRPEVNSGLPAVFSAVIREPLRGRDVTLPVGPDMPHAVCGFRPLVRNLLHLAQLPEAAFSASVDRTLNMPALSATLRELHTAMLTVVRDTTKLGKVSYEPDEALCAKLATFHRNMDSTRARSLGFFGDSSPADIVADFAAEYMDANLLKPVLEIQEEPRHNLVLSNDFVRVFQTETVAGDKTLMHAHRVDSLYFFFSSLKILNEKLGQEPVEDTLTEGEVRYGDHCRCPLVHRIHFKGPQPMLCLDVELVGFAAGVSAGGASDAEGQAPAKRTRGSEGPHVEGLRLTKERPGARVYELAVPAGNSWKGLLPFQRMLWVVKCGARVTGDFGQRLLRPTDVFYREGPSELSLQVLGNQALALWAVELR